MDALGIALALGVGVGGLGVFVLGVLNGRKNLRVSREMRGVELKKSYKMKGVVQMVGGVLALGVGIFCLWFVWGKFFG